MANSSPLKELLSQISLPPFLLPNPQKPNPLLQPGGKPLINTTNSATQRSPPLSNQQIEQLASKDAQANAINVHLFKAKATNLLTFGLAVRRLNAQWPFHQPIYGPQSPPLVAPNNNVGLDGMVINLASLLAGTTTNPFGNGYFQGPKDAPLEAASACPG
uniref:Uncharacterized protein n=1 Tax=Quercus lobata TaxID=97700 RepID=A0A7N2RFJ6_QUELO